jgi:hypothetical protein
MIMLLERSATKARAKKMMELILEGLRHGRLAIPD